MIYCIAKSDCRISKNQKGTNCGKMTMQLFILRYNMDAQSNLN